MLVRKRRRVCFGADSYGSVARKGGVSADRVLNALDLTVFSAHLEARKTHFAQTSAHVRVLPPRRRVETFPGSERCSRPNTDRPP